MKLWVGITDSEWFEFLARRRPDEVNFWQPSGARNFKVLQPGEPFLFKLHSPNNFIVGGGYFVRYSALPVSLAWQAFEFKNGVDSLSSLMQRVRKYRREDIALDPMIGCNILVEPFFLPREKWIPVPKSFALNIVTGKTYSTDESEGQALWQNVQDLLKATEVRELVPPMNGHAERFGEAFLTQSRLGQGTFRVLVTDAYQRRCAVTGEKTLPVLEAAHIQPYAQNGPHSISNGILLRSDLHKLFDLGYVTVTPDLHLEVSPRLRAEWQNGKEYYAHHGKALSHVPSNPDLLPGRSFLAWHNEKVFRP